MFIDVPAALKALSTACTSSAWAGTSAAWRSLASTGSR
jgi:hypothetical protein